MTPITFYGLLAFSILLIATDTANWFWPPERRRRRHRALLQAMKARHRSERAAAELMLLCCLWHPECEHPECEFLRELIRETKNTYVALLARQRAEIAALELTKAAGCRVGAA